MKETDRCVSVTNNGINVTDRVTSNPLQAWRIKIEENKHPIGDRLAQKLRDKFDRKPLNDKEIQLLGEYERYQFYQCLDDKIGRVLVFANDDPLAKKVFGESRVFNYVANEYQAAGLFNYLIFNNSENPDLNNGLFSIARNLASIGAKLIICSEQGGFTGLKDTDQKDGEGVGWKLIDKKLNPILNYFLFEAQ